MTGMELNLFGARTTRPLSENVSGYNNKRKWNQQGLDANIPQTLLDAIAVRERVFQQEGEFDEIEDRIAVHWVLYIVDILEPGDDGYEACYRGKRVSKRIPIGALRLVPIIDGLTGVARYVNKSNESNRKDGSENISSSQDRYPRHCGQNYVRLEKLAVLPQYRGKDHGWVERELIAAAREYVKRREFQGKWQIEQYFNSRPMPNVRQYSDFGFNGKLEFMAACAKAWERAWDGLVYAHARAEGREPWESLFFRRERQIQKWRELGEEYVVLYFWVAPRQQRF